MDLAGMKRRELQALCKRHGLPAGGTNAGLVARLDAALSGATGAAAEEEVAGVAARKGCLKRNGGDAAEAKKVTFAAEEGKARRLRSRVIWSPIVAKTRGKSVQATSDSAVAEDGISAEAGKNVPVRRSRRNLVCAAEAEEIGEVLAVGRKRKRKNENDEGIAVTAQVGVSARVTRRSSLAGAAIVLPNAVEKKRGRGKTAAGGSNKLVAQALDEQNSAQVEISARITRSRATAPVVVAPTVVENKRRRKTIDARTNVGQPTVSDVPKNDPPVTRSLRSRVVEDKHQEQIAAPNKAPVLRRSGRNHSEDAEKQPAVKEPVRRSTHKSVVLATLEKEENDLIEEKKPAAHVRRSTRKSIVPVKDIKGIGEEIQNANSEDAAKQPATKGPVRGSRRKSVVSELHEKEKGLIAEKNMEAHKGRSMRKSVMPVKGIKTAGEGIENAKGKYLEKQFVVTQPTRRSSRKSVLPVMLENNSGLLAAEMKAEMNVRRTTRKSVIPNMLNENQDDSKMSRKENFHSGKCQDDERQQKVKEPIRRSRRSVAAVMLEEQSNGLHEEKMSKNPMRRSTCKSVALNEVEKVSLDHTEIIAQEPERVGEVGLKLRKHRRSSLEISSSANDSWRKQQNTQIPNETENTGGTQQASNSTTSKERFSKRRRTTAPEEVMSVKEANDDIIIREATMDARKATHEYNKDEVQEICQVNATREEFSPAPLLVTVALADEICTVQSVPVVISGSESGGNANESSDKSKQAQEHSDTQGDDNHLSETRSGKLDQSTCIAGLVPDNCVVSEDKVLMSEGDVNMDGGLSIDSTVGYGEEQSPVTREGRVGLEANASEPGEINLANVMSTGLHAKSLQHDIDIIAEDADKDVLPTASPIEEHGERYAVSPVAVENSVGWEASACGSAETPLTGIFSNDLHTKHLQHDSDVLTKETGEASGAAPPISESDTNSEVQCNAEESIQAADLGKCPSLGSKGKPYPTNLHFEGAADDCILPVLNADKECSPDGRPSSYGLELMFAEACKENYSQNIGNTAVEIVGGNKPSTPVTPGFYVGSVCLGDEDVQPSGCDADKNPDVDQGIAGEENTAVEIDCGNKPSIPVAPDFYVGSDCLEDGTEGLDQEKCNDQHVLAKIYLKMKLNDELGPGMESGCSITEKNGRFVADNLDQQVLIQVQQGDMQECDLEKPSLCSATRESKHECGLPEEYTSVEIDVGNKPRAPLTPGFSVGSDCLDYEDVQPTECDAVGELGVDQSVSGEGNIAVTPGFYVRSDCLEDEDVQPTRCDTDKKLDVDQGVIEEEVLAQEKSNDQHVPTKTDLNMKINDELAGPSTESGCSITEKNARLVADNLDEQAMILVQQGDVEEATPFPEEIGGESTPTTPDCYDGSNCLEDEDVPPTGFDADKKLDVDQGVAEEEILAPTKTDLNMKLNDELASPCTESGCSVTEKNTRLFADNLDQQAIFEVQQGDVQEGDLKQPSPCSTTPECKHKYSLPEETILLPKNTGSLSSSEQSPFGLESLFSQENIDQSMGSATALTKNGFDDSKDCHVKSAHENTHASEPSLDDIVEAIPKNDDYMQTSQGNGMEGSSEANLDEERVLSVFSLDAKHINEVINFEEVACEDEGSKKLVHSEELKASSEKTHVNGLDGNAYSITGAVLSSALHTPANDSYEICLGSNTDMLHQGHHDQCRDDTEDIIEDSSAKYIERGIVQLSGKERSNLKDGQLNSKLEGAKVVDSGLHFNKDIGNILDSKSVGEKTPSGSGLQKDSSKAYRQEVLDGSPMEKYLDGSSSCGEKNVSRIDAIENPSISLTSTGYKREGALSEEATHTLKNYAGTFSSNPRELLMDLQSLFSKGNIKESNPHDDLAFPSAENSGDESINVEQRVKVHHGSDLSHIGSTDLLDELIGCSNAEVLHQSHNHEDRSIVDSVEQVASEPCTNDIVEAAADAECIESGLVINLNDGQRNPKLESPTNMGSGLNCDKYVCNTLANGSVAVVVGERTPSGSGLPEDYPKDHYPRQELLDGCSVESSLQGTIFRKKIVSALAGIGSPSSSLATPDYKYECALPKESGMSLVDPRYLIMELQSLPSEGSTEKIDLQDNLAFPSAESGRDESIVWHDEELPGTHVSSESEPDTYQRPCGDLSRHEEKESCMKGSLTSVQIDLADDAHLIERDIVAPMEVLCEDNVERKCMPTSDSDILQEKSYSNGHGICQSRSQKHRVEADSRLLSCGAGTEVLHQDHKEECNEHNEAKFSSKENSMSEDAPIEGMESSIMLPLVAGTSEIPDEQLNTKMSDENEELSLSCDKDTIENFCTGPANGDLYSLPKDFHIDTCQKLEVPEVVSLPKSPEESAKFQCASVSGSGPCQQHVNESTSMQVTSNIETVNQDHEEYNQNNEDQTTPGVLASSVPEAVEREIERSEMETGLIPATETSVLLVPDEQPNSKLEGNEDQIPPGISASNVPEAVEREIERSEMEIGLIPATETSVLPVPDEQPNSKLEGNEDQIPPGIPASSVPEAVEIEQSEMEIGTIPAAETSVLPVPDEQPNSKLEGSEVDEHSCCYDKDFFILSDSESLKREVSSLHKDDCMDLSSEDNHPNDLPAPGSPEQSAYFKNDNDSGSVGICQSSKRRDIAELHAKLQSFKVSSTVKESYIAMSAPRPKPGDSMSQSAIALLKNIENTSVVKAGHPVKPNPDGKDSSRRALQPISGRPREH